MHKNISAVLVLAFFMWFASFVQPIACDSPPGFIRITSDGSVVGTNLIWRNGNIYTFTGNISGGIAVEKDDVVIDGAGFTLQGPGQRSHNDGGLFWNFRSNVTIKNLHITACQIGIRHQFGNCIFEGNYITDRSTGIETLGVYGNNTFSGNTIASSVTFNYGGGDNYFYGNNFVNGGWVQGGFAPGKNTFDGNFWVAYNGTDADGDGIGDTPYVVYDNNVDNHPLMKPISSRWLPASANNSATPEQKPFSIDWIVVAVAVIIVGAGFSMLVYLVWRKQRKLSWLD